MKNVITGLLLVLATALPLAAQTHQEQSFLNYDLIVITNSIGITNLNNPNTAGTNLAYTKYLSANGTTNTVAAGTTNTVNLLKDVSLWSRTTGEPSFTSIAATNDAGVQGGFYHVGDATISVTYRSGATFASPGLTLTFAPVWDGVNADMNNTWTVGFTTLSPSLTERTTVSTNVPMARFVGAKKLRLLNVWNADATPLNSEVFLTDVILNGFVP